MPQRLDLGHVHAGKFGECLLGETRRDADAQGTGGELQEGEAAGGIEPVEQIAHRATHLRAAERVHAGHDGAQAGLDLIGHTLLALLVPDQRDGFGEVTDIVVGIAKQHRVHALEHQFAQQRRLDALQVQRAGDGGKAIAPVRIRRIAEVIGQQLQLAVARRGEDEAVEKGGEGLHGVPLPRNRRMQSTPLWPAGHLPHKGGDLLGEPPSLHVNRPLWARRGNNPISPLVGEMPGRAEGGEPHPGG